MPHLFPPCFCFPCWWFPPLPQVSHREPEEITFRIHQSFKIGVLQPAAVSVYEYYDRECGRKERLPPSRRLKRAFLRVPETSCVKFYHPERKAGELLQLCRNEECACVEGKQEDVSVLRPLLRLSYLLLSSATSWLRAGETVSRELQHAEEG